MKLLLDTHILLWSQLQSKRLSGRVARALDDARNERWISPVSLTEILTACRKGRLRLEGGPQVWIKATFDRNPTFEATITNEVAMATWPLALPHGDPADALLVASANVYGLTLVTADRKLIAAKACRILSNL